MGVNITFHRGLHPPPDTCRRRTPGRRSTGRPRAGHPPFFPGLREQVLLRAMLSIEGLRGRSAGKPTAPATPPTATGIHPRRARSRRTGPALVMNVTQCSGGRVAMELYETRPAVAGGRRHLRPRHHHRSGRRQTDVRAGAKSPRRTDAATSATRFARRILPMPALHKPIFFSIFSHSLAAQNERLTGCRPDETQDKILILRFLSGRVVM